MASSSPLSRLAPAVLAAGLTAVVACSPDDATATPDGAWRSFRKAVETGDQDAAWQLLSDEDRAALEQRAEAATEARGPGGEAIRPASLLSIDRPRLPPWRKSEVTIDGDTAHVTLTLDGDVEEVVEARRQGGAWRVVLGIPSR